MESEIPNKKIAIIFYGLTRSLNKTINSLYENIFNILTENSIEFDIFIHTYQINGAYKNDWSHENTANYINEDIDKLLKPKYYINDNQEDIINIINFEDYYKKLGNWTGMTSEMTKYLIKNLCLALYSKKQICNLFEEHKSNYDYAIILRPDLQLKTKIDMNWINELNDNNIIIPKCDWFYGCNDRFCIGKIETILYYGKLFDYLQQYSENNSIISEKFLLDMLNFKGIHILKKDIQYDTLRI